MIAWGVHHCGNNILKCALPSLRQLSVCISSAVSCSTELMSSNSAASQTYVMETATRHEGSCERGHSTYHTRCFTSTTAAIRPLQSDTCRQPMSWSGSCVNRGGVASSRSFSTKLPDSPNPLGPPAFVLDIDGVLIRGKRVLDAAKRAMEKLTAAGGQEWRYPTCFLTNGGGVTEARKAEQLSSWLNVDVKAEQVILSHTPMKDLVPRLGNVPVLVSGRGQVAEVAASYGFTQVYTVEQLGQAIPTATPFIKYQGTPSESDPFVTKKVGVSSNPFQAVLVMYDPSDWYRDLQLITDVLTSNGAPLESEPAQAAKPVELYFSNPDLLWANEFHRPRFGQGAFACALEALHKQVTGHGFASAHWFGKPNPEPYRLAERLLVQQGQEIGLLPDKTPCAHSSLPFSAIYGIGDNPASDIRGANAAGRPWVSVLVKTGVFQGPPGSNDMRDPAALVVNDVLAAVDAALHRARHLRWHSLR